MRNVCPVFKLSGLQYGHNAMIPCISFLILVRCNWIVVMYSHVQAVTKRSWCVSTSLRKLCGTNWKYCDQMMKIAATFYALKGG